MPRKPTCLFVGRFQPFHKGHLLVVQGMAKMCDKTIIAIGSTNKKDKDNPYTAEERRDMIQRALQAVDIIPMHDVSFVEMPDVSSDDEWTRQLLEKTGDIDLVWTGDENVKVCFEKKKTEVKWIKEVPGISATEVRKRVREGGDWKALVPPEVASSMGAIGAERIK
ncbi:adenylyltransferase/cytidyltransferase family protein [Candidatus Uhrbacteria bacterium]|nr:adenylyltransferase/cytidyltransferase family protein [Candidatus Uhrbacteria bacterium]